MIRLKAERHITPRQYRRISRPKIIGGMGQRQQARKIVDLFRKYVTDIIRYRDWIRKEIVHCWQPRAVPVSPCGYLKRSRLTREHFEPVSFRVPGEINENVNPVRLYLRRQRIVGKL